MRPFLVFAFIASLLVAPGLAQAKTYKVRAVKGSTVSGYHTERWTFTLEAGVSYRIGIKGDGSSDLDLVLRDENGHVIDRDLGPTDLAIVTVKPRWTGPFRLEVRNRGRSSNRYVVAIL